MAPRPPRRSRAAPVPDPADPLGSPDPIVVDGVRTHAAADGLLRLTAERDLDQLASGTFATVGVGFRFDVSSLPDDAELLGFAFTQFALPVTTDRSLDIDFAPAPGLHSPECVLPLLIRTGSSVTLIAPLSNPHEQIIEIGNGAVVWGWHGDLDSAPSGFETTARVYRGATADEVFERWGHELLDGPPSWRDTARSPLTSHLSYWTDNGAAYWYRTEPDRTIAESVVGVVDSLRDGDVPIRAIELDSWFYPHERSRAIAEFGYPDDVPPSGLERWEPRPDAYPDAARLDDSRDEVEWLADQLGRPPLILHSRHIAPDSSYVAEGRARGEEWWVGWLASMPADPAFFRRWFDDAARWGATCIEFDWLLLHWFGVDEIRSTPGRSAAWQRALQQHADATDVDLLWCMATPADFVVAAELDRMVAVRTCDDYRFADDPAFLWTWFLTVNRLTNALGLWPFKDCFFSHPEPGDDEIGGDVHAELEAALAALSGGPVGIGDRIGRTDREIVMRTCDDDGRIRHVSRPIAMIDDCLFGEPARGDRLAWATAATELDGRTWTYVLAINTAADRREIADRLKLDRIGVGPVAIYDWRERTLIGGHDAIEVTLASRDWALFVCCPVDDDGPVVGDRDKYVTVAAR